MTPVEIIIIVLGFLNASLWAFVWKRGQPTAPNASEPSATTPGPLEEVSHVNGPIKVEAARTDDRRRALLADVNKLRAKYGLPPRNLPPRNGSPD